MDIILLGWNFSTHLLMYLQFHNVIKSYELEMSGPKMVPTLYTFTLFGQPFLDSQANATHISLQTNDIAHLSNLNMHI